MKGSKIALSQEHTDFISVEKTVDDTARWLKGHGIDRLDALYGLSFGGAMAVRFLTTQDIPTERVVINAGTAPYHFPKWVCTPITGLSWSRATRRL